MKNIGNIFFKLRSITPIPIIIVYLFFFKKDPVLLITGIILILIGELIRLFAVSFIGSISRTRGDTPGALIETGPYAIIRNPLYVGNFFIFFGFILTSHNLWYIIISTLLFFLQYYFIIFWEEDVLEKKYGSIYNDYRKRVPSIFPSLKQVFNRDNFRAYDLKMGFRSEKWTFVTVFFLIMIPIVCFFFCDAFILFFQRIIGI